MTSSTTWDYFESYAIEQNLSYTEVIKQAINGSLKIAFDWSTYSHMNIKKGGYGDIEFSLDQSLIDPELSGSYTCPAPDRSNFINRLAVLGTEYLSELMQTGEVIIHWGSVGDIDVEIISPADNSSSFIASFKNLFVVFDKKEENNKLSDVSNVLIGLTHSSESLLIAAAVVKEFWEGKDPEKASKRATNDAVSAWILEEYPTSGLSNNARINIAMIVRPSKYKK